MTKVRLSRRTYEKHTWNKAIKKALKVANECHTALEIEIKLTSLLK